MEEYEFDENGAPIIPLRNICYRCGWAIDNHGLQDWKPERRIILCPTSFDDCIGGQGKHKGWYKKS